VSIVFKHFDISKDVKIKQLTFSTMGSKLKKLNVKTRKEVIPGKKRKKI
jgi:hypothetical protein